MKRILLAAFMCAVAPVVADPTLLITEVAEGSSAALKYVEIKNVSGASINLASPQISLRLYSNGTASPNSTVNLTGTLAAGGYYVIANNSSDYTAAFGLGNPASQYDAAVVIHNGDDGYDLFDGATVLDAFAADWNGSLTFGSDSTTRAACDGVYFRIGSALPNNGNWGGVNNAAPPTDGANSPSGYWRRLQMTPGNANASAIGTPFASGGAGGVEATLPVELDSFEVE